MSKMDSGTPTEPEGLTKGRVSFVNNATDYAKELKEIKDIHFMDFADLRTKIDNLQIAV